MIELCIYLLYIFDIDVIYTAGVSCKRDSVHGNNSSKRAFLFGSVGGDDFHRRVSHLVYLHDAHRQKSELNYQMPIVAMHNACATI